MKSKPKQQSRDRGRELFPKHLEHLRASGLTEQTIREAGIYSTANAAEVAAILNWKNPITKHSKGIVFPFYSLDGKVVLYRFRPDRPRLDAEDKEIKYESPVGSEVYPYFPPNFEKYRDSGLPLIITEGEKKALCATQFGFPTIGLAGVWGWKLSKTEWLLPALAEWQWCERVVYIAFDSDLASKAQVLDAERRLASELGDFGADVRVVRLPSGPNGEKVGLDDYLVQQQPRAKKQLGRLLKKAKTPEQPTPMRVMEPAASLDAAKVAGAFLAESAVAGKPIWRYWQGTWLSWEGGRYRRCSDSEVRPQLVAYLSARYFRLTTGTVSNVLEMLRGAALLNREVEPPAWLCEHDWLPGDCVVARNGIVHLPSAIAGEKCVQPLTPDLFVWSALSFDFQSTPPPVNTWKRFLKDLFEDDERTIQAMQEMFGLLLVSDTSLQKFFGFIGPTRSGKSTIARVLKSLLGEDNVTWPSLSSLGERFGLAPLLGKSLAVINEARPTRFTDRDAVMMRMLAITGEDKVTVEQKYQDALDVCLGTRFLLIANELPQFSDASGALAKRFVPFLFRKSFAGNEDTELTKKLLAELPGILVWAMHGLARLRGRGRILYPTGAENMIAEFERGNAPIRGFVEEMCRLDRKASIPRQLLYTAYRKWCEERGFNALNVSNFGRELRAAYPGVRDGGQHRKGGTRRRSYRGITLFSAAPAAKS